MAIKANSQTTPSRIKEIPVINKLKGFPLFRSKKALLATLAVLILAAAGGTAYYQLVIFPPRRPRSLSCRPLPPARTR
jgi:hypothetical protein